MTSILVREPAAYPTYPLDGMPEINISVAIANERLILLLSKNFDDEV